MDILGREGGLWGHYGSRTNKQYPNRLWNGTDAQEVQTHSFFSFYFLSSILDAIGYAPEGAMAGLRTGFDIISSLVFSLFILCTSGQKGVCFLSLSVLVEH